MGNLYKLALLFTAAAMMCSWTGCVPDDTDNDGVPDDADRCLTIAGPKINSGCPVIPQVKKIHLYLDNSASMEGYYKDLTEYKNIIADLAVKMDRQIKPVDISFIAHNTIAYSKNITEFTKDLATTSMAVQKSSELQRMIKDVTDHCGDHDVSLLVSDCILSFPDDDIKANPEVNVQNASSTLKNNIYTTFIDLKKRGFAASIYGFRSKFFGTYYDYQNQKTKLVGALRPFYIWVIAKRPILLLFNAGLDSISSFKPEHALHFGLLSQPVTNYTILPEMERVGDWVKSPSGISDVELPKGRSIQVGLVLNLENLPAYAKSISYLQSNLAVKAASCKAGFIIKPKDAVDRSRLKAESQVTAFENATHALILTISDMSLSQSEIHFNLPLKYDTWYKDWSTMNDKGNQFEPGKTFALEHLINGVKEAYETPNSNYIDFSLLLTK